MGWKTDPLFCWKLKGAAYINPLTVISIVEAVKADKSKVFIHTVRQFHWKMADLPGKFKDFKGPRNWRCKLMVIDTFGVSKMS